MNEQAFDDEGGDVPPVGGFDDAERRHSLRREQDTLRARAESWTGALFVHKLLPLIIVAGLTFLGTSLANRIMWPRDDIKAVRSELIAKDSLMNIRVTRIEERQATISDRLGAIEEQGRFISTLLCISLRTSNPNLALDGCPSRRQ